MSTAPAGFPFTVRRPRADEVDAIVDLMNACTIAAIGVPDADAEELLRSWRKSTFDRDRDAWVVEAADGRLAGSVHVELEGSEGDLLIDGYTHPAFLGHGIGSHLSDLAERRAQPHGQTEAHATWWLPEDAGGELPLFFALRATKPS